MYLGGIDAGSNNGVINKGFHGNVLSTIFCFSYQYVWLHDRSFQHIMLIIITA